MVWPRIGQKSVTIDNSNLNVDNELSKMIKGLLSHPLRACLLSFREPLVEGNTLRK